MKMQGKVKAIPVPEVTAGTQVLVDGDDAIFTIITVDSMSGKVRITCKESGNIILNISELKTLVVEYVIKNPPNIRGLSKIIQLPLKYSQWQSAINNGEVNSDKIVEFELIERNLDGTKYDGIDAYDGKLSISYAKIIPQKKILYTEEEVKELMHQVWVQSDRKRTDNTGKELGLTAWWEQNKKK